MPRQSRERHPGRQRASRTKKQSSDRQAARNHAVSCFAGQGNHEHAFFAAAANFQRLAIGSNTRIAHDPCGRSDRYGTLTKRSATGASCHHAVRCLRVIERIATRSGAAEGVLACPRSAVHAHDDGPRFVAEAQINFGRTGRNNVAPGDDASLSLTLGISICLCSPPLFAH